MPLALHFEKLNTPEDHEVTNSLDELSRKLPAVTDAVPQMRRDDFNFQSFIRKPFDMVNADNYIEWNGFYIDEAQAATRADTGPVTVVACTGVALS